MKQLLVTAIVFLFACNTSKEIRQHNKHHWKVNKDGILIPYADRKKGEPSKDVMSNGDTLYSNVKTHTMLWLLPSGDTVIIMKP